jgi:hypothetical protein
MMAGYRKGTIGTADFLFDAQTGALLTTTSSGLPIPLQSYIADPGNSAYTATSVTLKAAISRACTILTVMASLGGVVVSLDGGVTDSISCPPGLAREVAVPITAGMDIRVKRFTPGTAFTGLVLEVR